MSEDYATNSQQATKNQDDSITADSVPGMMTSSNVKYYPRTIMNNVDELAKEVKELKKTVEKGLKELQQKMDTVLVDELAEKVDELKKRVEKGLKELQEKMDTVVVDEQEGSGDGIPNMIQTPGEKVTQVPREIAKLVREEVESQIKQKLQLQDTKIQLQEMQIQLQDQDLKIQHQDTKIQDMERFMQTMATRLDIMEGKSAEAEDVTTIRKRTKSLEKVKEEISVLHEKQDKTLDELVDEQIRKEVKKRTLKRHPSITSDKKLRWSFPLSPIHLDDLVMPGDVKTTPTRPITKTTPTTSLATKATPTTSPATEATPTTGSTNTPVREQKPVMSHQRKLSGDTIKLPKLPQK